MHSAGSPGLRDHCAVPGGNPRRHGHSRHRCGGGDADRGADGEADEGHGGEERLGLRVVQGRRRLPTNKNQKMVVLAAMKGGGKSKTYPSTLWAACLSTGAALFMAG